MKTRGTKTFRNENDMITSKKRITTSKGKTQSVLKQEESNLDKYFKDSIILSENNHEKFEENVLLNIYSSKKKQQIHFKDHLNYQKINEENISGRYVKNKNHCDVNIIAKHCNLSDQSLYENNSTKSGLQSTVKNTDNTTTCNNIISFSKEHSSSIKCYTDSIESNTILSSHVCTQDRCKLVAWGLPPNILQKYEARGIFEMFPWQVECLSNNEVLEKKRNLLYSAPTSAGKTLVAEILLIKTVLECKKKAIFILPFVSVVREKMYYFKDLLSDSGIKVEGFMGGEAPVGGFATTNVAIATIEKANSLINRLMEDGDLSTLGIVIIDELHLVGDPNRGYLLELLLTKLKYMTLREEKVNIQLIGMSATLPNLPLMAKWLNAELYETKFRPVPLNEQCKIGNSIYDNKLNRVRDLISLPELQTDTENILQLCIETISEGHSVLIFCSTKNWCEKLAQQVAAAFFKLGKENSFLSKILKEQLNSTSILETLEQLKRSPSGLDNILKNTVSFGVAFHHAGLTMDERDVLEGAFRLGSLRVLTATSTLSSGVNLPARRVIIRSPMFGGKLIDTLTYKQMIGRAGRMGKNSAGESILICKQAEQKAAASLLSATLEPIVSCLQDSGPLIRALLEAVASEVVFTQTDLELYINCTLISLNNQENLKDLSFNAVKFLVDNEFFLLKSTEQEQKWIATPLGKACLAASLSPRDGLFLFEELLKARKCFVLDTELHVVYLVTPVHCGNQITNLDWIVFFELWKKMSESERRVGQLIGIEERFLTAAIRGIIRPGKLLNIHKRFYTALALHDLVREIPLNTVCQKYGCCRGVLQSLQQSAATFAGMVTQFCKQLGWTCLELLVSQFQTRLQFGVCRELLDLLRLSMLNGLRARSLYKQGITCVADLAVANVLDVERALCRALPFESEKEHDGEHESEAIKRNKIRTIFVTGKDGLTPHQAAIILVQEARLFIQNELGLQNVSWKQKTENISSDVLVTQNIINNEYVKETDVQKQNTEKIVYLESTKESLLLNNDHLFKNPVLQLNEKAVENIKYLCIDSHTKENVEIKNIENKCNNETINNFKNNCTSNDVIENCKYDRQDKGITESETLKYDNINCTSKKINISSNKDCIINYINDDLNTSLQESIESQVSRSPTLFDESLNLDTQMYNILEQNIIDSLHISDFENTNMSQFKSCTRNKRSRDIKMDIKRDNENNQTFNKHPDNDPGHSENKNPTLSWNDDSWNKLTKVTNKTDLSKQGTKKVTNTFCIRDIINTSFVEKETTPNQRHENNENSLTWHDNDSWNDLNEIKLGFNKKTIKKVEDERRALNKTHLDCQTTFVKNHPKSKSENKSILTSFKKFNSNQNVSSYLNESDSDDIIVPSQNTELSVKTIKNTTKLKPKTNKKIFTQQINLKESNTKLSEGKSRYRKIFTRNIFLHENFNTVSIISNSDEDIPIKKNKIIQKRRTKTSSPKKKIRTDIEDNLPCKTSDNLNDAIDWNTLNIVKIGVDRSTFNVFKQEVSKRTSISLALNCEVYINEDNHIGSKIISSTVEGKDKLKKLENCVYENQRLCGAAISWGGNVAYYISFYDVRDLKISAKEQMNLLKVLLYNPLLYVKCFAAKEVYKILYQCCKISAKCKFLDPNVADWLLNNNVSDKRFDIMVLEYFPQGSVMIQNTEPCNCTHFKLNTQSTVLNETETSVKATLTWHIMDVLFNKLQELCPTLLYTFKEIEMKTITILACMELTGLQINLKSLQELSAIIQGEMLSLENRAYSLSGQKFNFASPKEVAQILGLYNGKKVHTNKTVLEQCDNPVSNIIVSWRKLNVTLTRIIHPLINLAQYNSRIRGNCITRTVTGRISMHEPNLQNIPRDFNSEDNRFVISVRMAFISSAGNIMLSADYCQLELRILAHFSKDVILCDIMKKEGDIFRSIAATWNKVTEDKIDDKMRQRTKQLCYGMIYGMGVKKLADHLSVCESEAMEFLDSFMNAYPGISQWLDKIVKQARENGYVTTLMGRRRKLPNLKSLNLKEQLKAERQAVNTTVQGSGADIVKNAMININDRMQYEFSDSTVIIPVSDTKRKLRNHGKDAQQRGGYLVLQLHDELLFEVNIIDLQQVAMIIKESMEQVCHLAVPLPVKIKVGPAWGNLTEYHV